MSEKISSNFLLVVIVFLYLLFCVNAEKYKLCVVDGKGGFKRSGRYCPTLDKPDSKVECILGIDRLDCLRRISKGQADFSVFSPEDLVTAANSEIEILITNELKYTRDKFEYEVVAVIENHAGIRSKHDLKDKRFCHPGYGYETDWTRILANYLEAVAIPQNCETKYTITENRIRSSSQFFKSACKAGPWVNNPKLDQELKLKYTNLCGLCDNVFSCGSNDKYWGRRGSLYCLTDGAGDISWARLDDVKVHFGLAPGMQETSPNGYSFLCPDDSIRPLNTTNPCVWVVKPWQVIATRRAVAQEIQNFIENIDENENIDSWKTAVRNLIETYHFDIKKLDPVEPIESYLERATGFLNANSFSGCHPPRTIRICTTSVLENAKCLWMRESAVVYGIEPDLDCLLANNVTHCMEAVSNLAADVVMVTPDVLKTATNKYNLKTLFYETVNQDAKYLTVAVTRNGTVVEKLDALKGFKACFPNQDGISINTVAHTLRDRNLVSCDSLEEIETFFGTSCVPGSMKSPSFCNDKYSGDFGALRCLLEQKGDVAFVSRNSILDFVKSPIENKFDITKLENFIVLCEKKSEGCHLSWAPVGQAMIRGNTSDIWIQDAFDVFMQLDNLFGRNYKSLTTPLQLFGPYNGKANILFHDSTVRLKNVPILRNYDSTSLLYEDMLKNDKTCKSSSPTVTPILFSVSVLFSFIFVAHFIVL